MFHDVTPSSLKILMYNNMYNNMTNWYFCQFNLGQFDHSTKQLPYV